MIQPHYQTVSKQRGAVLLMTLVVLLVMTLIGVQLISRGNVNQVLVQNENARAMTEELAQNVANIILSDVNNFISSASAVVPVGNNLTVHIDNGPNNIAHVGETWVVGTLVNGTYNLTVSWPQCVREEPVEGYSLQATIVPQHYFTSFWVEVEDTFTGASTRINTGANFNFTAGNCGP